MSAFDELARELSLTAPVQAAQWTLYQCPSDAFLRRGASRDPADWGMVNVYRFDRGLPPALIPRIVELDVAIRLQISNLGLANVVRLVPHYEVGLDYVVQPKPPYDGGYDSSRFGDFVCHRECKPPPGFVRSRAELLDVLIEKQASVDGGSRARTNVLRAVLHNSLIRPWSELFWDVTAPVPWVLYRACIEPEEVEAWIEGRSSPL